LVIFLFIYCPFPLALAVHGSNEATSRVTLNKYTIAPLMINPGRVSSPS